MRIKSICLLTILFVFVGCVSNEISNPTIKTLVVYSFDSNSATGGGQITSNGSQKVTAIGVCWSLKQNPTYADNHTNDSLIVGEFTSKITNLNADSTYYLRAYCVMNKDTLYGNQVTFKTSNNILFNPDITYGLVSDIDGNTYKTVVIGTKTWMAENLKVTHFQNGELVSNVTDLSKWGYFQITTSAYCWYNNNSSNKNIYGALYNWYAASDSRNIAPSGWHVASAEDWQSIKMYLNPINGGYSLHEATTAHWKNITDLSPIANITGFTALPGGKIATSPFGFMEIGGSNAYFWTKTGTLDGSTCVYINSELSIDMMQPNCIGFSVRCVKD